MTLHTSSPIAKGIRYVTVTLCVFLLTVWQFIDIHTRCRSRDAANNDIVGDIDNVRNGFLLHQSARRALGKYIAFLVVCSSHVI